MRKMITLTLYMVALKMLDFIDNLKKNDDEQGN
jgi:hypothetical protein